MNMNLNLNLNQWKENSIETSDGNISCILLGRLKHTGQAVTVYNINSKLDRLSENEKGK
eukprot:jgi/Psemu1/301336/fgenesh1_kg.31_\